MADLIDRQAAIDAIRTKYCPSDFMDDGVIDAFAEIIQDLPYAQPEVIACGEGVLTQSGQDGSRLVQDTISRQAAIDEFRCCELTPDGGIDVNYAIEFLEQLPSAQPERKTGKWTGSHGIYCDRAWCSNCSSAFPIDPNHPFKTPMDWKYCPDCGAKMEVEHDNKIYS